ncbi:carbohydrate ABC transporter permease [Lentibacillus sediminis]|uniref:carbohydrate ABC transporter permease n=1 Tax=Lentibacillus sediminis TaxID=1940529 RepID=UPI000C1B9BE2|nr:carbohydrate ABC transporter permease [Lentibacillus sediminis]
MKNRTLSEKIFDAGNIILLAIIAFIMLFPLLYVFSVSFSSMQDFITKDFIIWPENWVTDAYQYIFASEQFIRSIFVSIFVTIVGTIVNLAFTATMAYGLTRNAPGQRPILFMVVFSLIFQAGMIPTYLVVDATGLLDTVWSLIIPIAIAPFNLIVMRQFFLNIPNELIESAFVDGANELQIFGRIILPLSKPALAAIGLFYAVNHWNNYFHGMLYISDPAKWPIQVVLRQMVITQDMDITTGQLVTDVAPPPETIQMAAVIVATVPILIVYPFLQKHFAKGVMLGAVKG